MTNYIFKTIKEFEEFIDNCVEYKIPLPKVLYVSSSIRRDIEYMANSGLDVCCKLDMDNQLIQIGDIYVVEKLEKYPFTIGDKDE